ncbi:MAG: DMT family transporter [Acidobacteriota bacterium]|nr:DMT family transporter [Acidobacteriota bacterium]
MTVTVAFALAAAFANAAHLMTQHAASADIPEHHRGVALVGYLFRHPLWLLGWVAAAGGFAFQALALHNGALSVVQPLLVTELVFALLLRRFWVHQEISGAAWGSALVVVVALAAFLSVASPTGGHPVPNKAEWASALLTFGGIVAGLSALGWRKGSPVRRAALFAAAASITWALMATFIKAATQTLTAHGVFGMLAHWPVYALLLSGVVGTVVQQAALQSGPLSVSQPVLIVVDPAAAIVLSVWLFDDRLTGDAVQVAGAVVAFVVMAAGVVALSRTAPADLAPSGPSGP